LCECETWSVTEAKTKTDGTSEQNGEEKALTFKKRFNGVIINE